MPDIDPVTLSIAGKVFRNWDSLRLRFGMDEPSSCAFSAPFEPGNRAQRETFRPLSFQPVDVAIDGDPVISATMMTPIPMRDASSRTVSVSAYSREAVLNDTTPSVDDYPTAFEPGQRLRSISDQLGAPFGVSSEFTAPEGGPFPYISLEPEKKILKFLGKLAQERGLIIGSTPTGGLLYQQETSAPPVAIWTQGNPPVTGVVPQIRSQDYYSEITALGPSFVGQPGAAHKVINTRAEGIYRPFTYRASDADLGDLPLLTEARMGRMFANAASYVVNITGWRDSHGDLWRPNTRIRLTAPDAMIYQPYTFLVRWVELIKTTTSRHAVLGLTLPGVFSGKVPERFPWEE